MRHWYFVLAAVVLVGCGSLDTGGTDSNYWVNGSIVRTEQGLVQGREGRNDTWVWKGIPYAAPPLEELRWRAPQPAEPWNGVYKAKSFCSPCAQFSAIFPRKTTGSEDCLYLNVWRPQTDETGLPIYVFIHGGGNSIGSAHMVPDYHGHGIASQSNMIYVSLNYRLGPFGWYTSPAMRATSQNPDDASGNYGTLDIIMALRWIKKNAAAFGGDPSRLVVTGESAGGINVTSLLLSPHAVDLFSHAMSQSGGMMLSTLREGDESSARSLARLLSEDGDKARADMNPAETRQYLTDKSAKEILRSYSTSTAGMTGSPAVFADGHVIPHAGYNLILSGTQPVKVPLILGSNKDEVKLFFAFDPSFDWQSELYQAAGKYGSMRWKAEAVDALARGIAGDPGHPPVYAYRFDWGSPDEDGVSPLPKNWGLRLGAAHTFEIPFFLGTDTLNGPLYTSRLFVRGNRKGREALSAAMMSYVESFVKTDNPNQPGDDKPDWEPWSNDNGGPKTMLFDVDGDLPKLKMTNVEDTLEGILSQMAASLEEPQYSETLGYLDQRENEKD